MAADPFKILGCERPCSLEQLKSAYRRLARQHHPDRGGDAAKMAEINQAFKDAVATLDEPAGPEYSADAVDRFIETVLSGARDALGEKFSQKTARLGRFQKPAEVAFSAGLEFGLDYLRARIAKGKGSP